MNIVLMDESKIFNKGYYKNKMWSIINSVFSFCFLSLRSKTIKSYFDAAPLKSKKYNNFSLISKARCLSIRKRFGIVTLYNSFSNLNLKTILILQRKANVYWNSWNKPLSQILVNMKALKIRNHHIHYNTYFENLIRCKAWF